MIIQIDNSLQLEPVDQKHALALFELVAAQREYFSEWLPWVDHMLSADFISRFIEGAMLRNMEAKEHAFVIMYNNCVAGRIGVHKIDLQNRIGEIGYWLDSGLQGKGIVTMSCKALVDHCFTQLRLNRIEIKCGTANLSSRKVPERLNFTCEGVIRQGELIRNSFIDLKLYALLKEEWVSVHH